MPITAFANPTTDFALGKVSLDFTYMPSLQTDFNGTIKTDDGSLKNSGTKQASSPNGHGLVTSLTIGLKNDFAFQYRHFSTSLDEFSYNTYGWGSSDCNSFARSVLKVDTDEFNLVKRIHPSTSVFIGAVSIHPQVDYEFRHWHPVYNDIN